ncbi:MAG: hypothetical protein GY928_00370 [Colwellia sp.]|nr:hypothetical protein [Colwellia sp.]
MSDVMLHGVLRMPPELWQDTEIDKQQRHSRYLEASKRIIELEQHIARLDWMRVALDYQAELRERKKMSGSYNG